MVCLQLLSLCNNAKKYVTLYSNVSTEIHVVNVYASFTQGTVCFCDYIQVPQNLNMLYSGILLGKSGRLSRTNGV